MAVYKYSYFPDIHEYRNPLSRITVLERVDRPKVPVKFSFKDKNYPIVWCLLDSGADNIVLNTDFAVGLGINLEKAPQFTTGVVGGGTIKVRRHPIDILFEGNIYKLEADFSDTHQLPLLGRAFFNVLDSVVIKDSLKQVEIVTLTSAN